MSQAVVKGVLSYPQKYTVPCWSQSCCIISVSLSLPFSCTVPVDPALTELFRSVGLKKCTALIHTHTAAKYTEGYKHTNRQSHTQNCPVIFLVLRWRQSNIAWIGCHYNQQLHIPAFSALFESPFTPTTNQPSLFSWQLFLSLFTLGFLIYTFSISLVY